MCKTEDDDAFGAHLLRCSLSIKGSTGNTRRGSSRPDGPCINSGVDGPWRRIVEIQIDLLRLRRDSECGVDAVGLSLILSSLPTWCWENWGGAHPKFPTTSEAFFSFHRRLFFISSQNRISSPLQFLGLLFLPLPTCVRARSLCSLMKQFNLVVAADD